MHACMCMCLQWWWSRIERRKQTRKVVPYLQLWLQGLSYCWCVKVLPKGQRIKWILLFQLLSLSCKSLKSSTLGENEPLVFSTCFVFHVNCRKLFLREKYNLSFFFSTGFIFYANLKKIFLFLEKIIFCFFKNLLWLISQNIYSCETLPIRSLISYTSKYFLINQVLQNSPQILIYSNSFTHYANKNKRLIFMRL